MRGKRYALLAGAFYATGLAQPFRAEVGLERLVLSLAGDFVLLGIGTALLVVFIAVNDAAGG